jgi:glycosyltransferase involved in cell wall biosynthesis
MNVLHILSGLDPRAGGPANALVGLATAQANAGMDVAILSTWKEGWDESLANRIREDHRIALTLVGPISGWRKTHPHVPRVAMQAVASADLVHIHALWESIQLAASRAARQLRKPVIFRPCGMLDPWSMDQGGWKKRAYLNLVLRRELNNARLIHYTTQSEADLAAQWKLKAPPIVVPNGLNLPEFNELPARGAFRAHHDIAPGAPIVLFMSRVHPKKGLDLLIPAFAKVAAQSPDALLVIAGPPYLDTQLQMERLAEQCGVADRVRFVGMLTGMDRVQALVDSDLFVLPSRQENFGIVVAEAMAAARPVIVSDQVNLHGDVSAAGAGEVVPLEIGALANSLARWLPDEAARQEAGTRARAHALATWDWNVIARKWAGIYAGEFKRER